MKTIASFEGDIVNDAITLSMANQEQSDLLHDILILAVAKQITKPIIK